MRKLWLTLTMTALFAGSTGLAATPSFAANDSKPDGSYAMDLNDDATMGSDVEDDTYSDDYSLDDIDPELLKESDQYDTYLNGLGDLLEYEDKAWAAYNTNDYVSSENRKQEYQLMTYTVIPNYIKFVSGLKQLKPENAEVAKIHAQYVKGAYTELEGFMLYKKYVSSAKMNDQLLKKAQAKLTAGSALVEQFYSDMDEYSVRFDALYDYGDEVYEDDSSVPDTEQGSLDDFV